VDVCGHAVRIVNITQGNATTSRSIAPPPQSVQLYQKNHYGHFILLRLPLLNVTKSETTAVQLNRFHEVFTVSLQYTDQCS